MREIKFRAWDTRSQHWEVGSDRALFWEELGALSGKIEDGDTVLMQFTGLKDKNGKEIYEGDIVETPHKLMKKYKWQIIFHKGAFVLSDGIGFRHFYSQKYTQKYGVIGNIYENPNL